MQECASVLDSNAKGLLFPSFFTYYMYIVHVHVRPYLTIHSDIALICTCTCSFMLS